MYSPGYGMVQIKDPLLLAHGMEAAGFLSNYLNGPLSYNHK